MSRAVPSWIHRLAGSRPACGAAGRVRAVRFRGELAGLVGVDVRPCLACWGCA